MKTATFFTLIVFFILSLQASAIDPGADEILGMWLNHEKDAHIEVYKCEDTFCGKIVWLKNPNEDGAPKKDKHNPDDTSKSNPILGLDMLSGFSYKGNKKWDDGKIYNPREGKTYSCYLNIKDDGSLKVRGFIGLSIIGKTNYWTRVK